MSSHLTAMDGTLKRLGARIRACRRELGLTQAELAHGKCSKSFISQIEQGLVWPSLPAMIHIARNYNGPSIGSCPTTRAQQHLSINWPRS